MNADRFMLVVSNMLVLVDREMELWSLLSAGLCRPLVVWAGSPDVFFLNPCSGRNHLKCASSMKRRKRQN